MVFCRKPDLRILRIVRVRHLGQRRRRVAVAGSRWASEAMRNPSGPCMELAARANRPGRARTARFRSMSREGMTTQFAGNQRIMIIEWNGIRNWIRSEKCARSTSEGEKANRAQTDSSRANPLAARSAMAFARVGESLSDSGRSSRMPRPAAYSRKAMSTS